MRYQAQPSSLAAGILVRVVPSGLEDRGGRRFGLATLSLMPWVPDGTASVADPVALDDWPAAVGRLLKCCDSLLVKPIPKGGTQTPMPEALPKERAVPIRLSAPRRAQDHEGRIGALWRDLMGGGYGWSALAQALRDGQAGSSLDDLACQRTDEAGGGPAPAGAASGTRPDVFAYPRADAALLYGFERAREVLRAMKGQRSACQVGSCAIPTGGRRFAAGDLTFEAKPWLGLDGPLVRLAQAVESDAPLGSTSLTGFALRDELLAQERAAQEAAYRRQLAAKAMSAQNQAERRNQYLDAKDVQGRADALKAHAAERATSIPPSGCADACGPSTDDSITQRLTDDVKATHSLGSLPDAGGAEDADLPSDTAFEQAVEDARHRFYAIQGMPSLSRLFNFVVDVEFDLADLFGALGLDEGTARTAGFREWGAIDHFSDLTGDEAGLAQLTPAEADSAADQAAGDVAHLMFASCSIGHAGHSASGPPRLWTIAKLRPPRTEHRDTEAGHWWPCTREEVDLRLAAAASGEGARGADIRGSCAVFQYDGVLDLGVALCLNDGTRNPRYDLVSLDTVQAVESDIQSDRRLKSRADAAATGDAAPGDLGVQTRRTGGLAVLDRWRQDHVVSQIATAQRQLAPGAAADVVLDAEELTTAYRLDVGLRTSSKRRRVWRSLMNRTMCFVPPDGPAAWLEEALEAAYRWPEACPPGLTRERRSRADGGSLSTASRIRANGPGNGGGAPKTVFAEEIMIAWTGDPLGLECLDPHGSPDVRSEPHGLSIPASGLPLEIHYGLEDGADAYRPPPLRYGWPYHFGLRPVYLGGVVLPLEAAIPRYERNFAAGSALPSPREQEGRRFLRHERIEAPLLAVPEAIAEEAVAARGAGADRAAADNGSTCLLRTWLSGPPPKRDPASTVRILMPPLASLEQAASHGAFDDDRVETVAFPKAAGSARPAEQPRVLVRPLDGLKAIDFSGDRDAPADEERGGFPHHSPAPGRPGEATRGPAVFRSGAGRGPRHIPFYPDPAATFYVISARRPDSDDRLDRTLVLPVHSERVRYPDVLPLAIEVRRLPHRRAKPATSILDLVIGDATAVARAGDVPGIRGPGAPGILVRHLVLGLAPGEEYDIDAWCAPSAADLHRCFDIVESISTLLIRESAAEGMAEGLLEEACVAGLSRNLPGFSRIDGPFAKTGNPLCGPGGASLPARAVLGHVAEAVADALRTAPMPELAAVTRLRLTHAIDRPLLRPRFSDDPMPAATLRLARLAQSTLDGLFAGPDPQGAKAALLLAEPGFWGNLCDDGATNAIFGGNIEVDMLSTREVTIRARLASPSSPTFDDPKRGRTAEEKARGSFRRPQDPIVPGGPGGWPPRPQDVTGPLWTSAWPPLPQSLTEAESRALFGFVVAADGRVTLPKSAADLTLVHDLPDTPIAARDSDLRCYDLLDEQRRAGRRDRAAGTPGRAGTPADPADRAARIQSVEPFHDGLARELRVSLVATSRFENLYPEPAPGSAGEARRAASQERTVWLPATRRPDRISAKSLRPSFLWSPDKRSVEPTLPDGRGRRQRGTTVRTCAVNLPFARPHFTSGEGERVGIVIWPPDLLDGARPADIAADRVRRGERDGDTVFLDGAFSDSDLGPGGAFVSRWGADPVRSGARPAGWLIPAAAFTDHVPPEDGPFGADGAAKAALDGPKAHPAVRLERNVLMPIPRQQDGPGTDDDAPGREFMLVSLLTYEPRFDIDYEHWYVDVGIDTGEVPEPFLRLGLVRFQEHARRELQVSEPIAEWVQLMPRREVCATASRADGRADGIDLAVEVTSPARYDGGAPALSGDQCSVRGPGAAPVLRLSILRTDTDAGGRSIQSVVAAADATAGSCAALFPLPAGGGTSWSGSVTFATTAPPPGGTAEFAAYVEEVEGFLPAAGPGDGGAPAGAVESGPRFAAIVPFDLPMPDSPAPLKRSRRFTLKPAHRPRR